MASYVVKNQLIFEANVHGAKKILARFPELLATGLYLRRCGDRYTQPEDVEYHPIVEGQLVTDMYFFPKEMKYLKKVS